MKISWIKAKKDEESFRFLKHMGFDITELDDLEKTDEVMKGLIQKNYNTIVLTNEVAGFSQDIIKKYNKMESVNIIIAPNKE